MNEHSRITLSLCPTCYRIIPAAIHATEEGVVMTKTCPGHGDFAAMVERDPVWWGYCEQLGCKNIYDGYMIDVTDRCNLQCKYCYRSKGDRDATVEDVVCDARQNKGLGPIILTGGEPTLHPQLPEIIRQLQGLETFVLTNGIRLCDEAYFDEIRDAGLTYGNLLMIGLSFHRESAGKDLELLELCRKKGLSIPTAFWVIDALEQMEEALTTFEEYRDVIFSLRIKAASNLWAEGKALNRIFTSDMLKWLQARGRTEMVTGDRNNKTSFANVVHNGQLVMLISWYDATNVDLMDIECGPYYRANDGTINNLVTTGLINEGMRKRGCHGKAV